MKLSHAAAANRASHTMNSMNHATDSNANPVIMTRKNATTAAHNVASRIHHFTDSGCFLRLSMSFRESFCCSSATPLNDSLSIIGFPPQQRTDDLGS